MRQRIKLHTNESETGFVGRNYDETAWRGPKKQNPRYPNLVQGSREKNRRLKQLEIESDLVKQ